MLMSPAACAIAYAARYPERVSHLVLYSTYARGRFRVGRPEVSERARLMLELTRLGWGRESHAFMQVWASTFQPGGSLDYLRSWAEQMQLATTPETAVRLLEIGWNVDVSEAARKLECPVLVIHPDRDCAVPLAEGRLPRIRRFNADSDGLLTKRLIGYEPSNIRRLIAYNALVNRNECVPPSFSSLPLPRYTGWDHS
jgi:pimeloyl-ACP methyl ester carboxylesterase